MGQMGPTYSTGHAGHGSKIQNLDAGQVGLRQSERYAGHWWVKYCNKIHFDPQNSEGKSDYNHS